MATSTEPRQRDRARVAQSPTPSPTASRERSFSRQLRRSVRPVDLAAILLVPLVLVAASLLPTDARLGLAVSYADPTLTSAFTAAYVHIGTEHLLYNLATYALVVPTAYALSVMAGHRGRFYLAFWTFLLAFPVVLSLSTLAVSQQGIGLGFSGVNMAFVGYLPLALAAYLRETFDVQADHALAAALFFGGLALVSLLLVRRPVTLAIAAVAALAALWKLRAADVGLPRSGTALGRPGEAELVVVAVFLQAGALVAAFPSDLSFNGAIVNVYAHLLGYALGFIATALTVRTGGSLEADPAVAALRARARTMRSDLTPGATA